MELNPVVYVDDHWTSPGRPERVIEASDELVLVTFNTWFADYEYDRRGEALMDLLERSDADVIVLQNDMTKGCVERSAHQSS